MKNYKAKREPSLKFILLGILLLPIAIFLLDTETFLAKPFILLPLLVPVLLIVWVFFNTNYKIKEYQLHYRFGVWRGKIEINSITEIIIGKTLYSGKKPAMARNGLIIKYNKFEEIYVAPENKDEMIEDLLQLNPDIRIIQYKKISP